jgi:hypothetical protein
MFGGGGGGGQGYRQHSSQSSSMNVFLRSYKAYSPAFFGKNNIDKGNKSKKQTLFSPIYSHFAIVSPA